MSRCVAQAPGRRQLTDAAVNRFQLVAMRRSVMDLTFAAIDSGLSRSCTRC